MALLKTSRLRGGFLLAGAFALAGGWAMAQEPATLSDPDEGQYPLLLDGTLSGDGDLKEDNSPHSGFFRFPTMMHSWNQFKATVREETGVSFGGSWGVLYQNFSDVPPDTQTDTVGQKLTLNISRDLFIAGTPAALTFDLVIEDRGPMGGFQNPPLQAGIAAGSIAPTAATWGDFNLGITQAYIRQNLWGNKFQYTLSKIFAPNFINSYPIFDDNRQFLNQSFSTSPTIALPLRGVGAVTTYCPTEGGVKLLRGVYYANSSDIDWTIDEVFDTGELVYEAEIDWNGLARTGMPVEARGPMDTNNVHLTAWYKDAQPDWTNPSLRPSAKGLASNANFMTGDNVMWFLPGGASEGWVNDGAVSTGFGWRPTAQYSDMFGFGWVRPNENRLPGLMTREQWRIEACYRFHDSELRDHARHSADQEPVSEPRGQHAMGRRPARASRSGGLTGTAWSHWHRPRGNRVSRIRLPYLRARRRVGLGPAAEVVEDWQRHDVTSAPFKLFVLS